MNSYEILLKRVFHDTRKDPNTPQNFMKRHSEWKNAKGIQRAW